MLSPSLDRGYADRLTLTLEEKQTYEEAVYLKKGFMNSDYPILRNISSLDLNFVYTDMKNDVTQRFPNCVPRIPSDPRPVPK